MLSYILRRIVLAVPTVLVISLATFGLSKCAPYDPVYAIFGDNLVLSMDPVATGEEYRMKLRQIRQDMPDFYFSIQPAIFPDSMHRIYPPERRARLQQLTAHAGDWETVTRYEKALSAFARSIDKAPDSLIQKPLLRAYFKDLTTCGRPEIIDTLLRGAAGLAQGTVLSSNIDTLRQYNAVLKQPIVTIRRYQPTFHWHGPENQYHRWMGGFLNGDLGVTVYGKPVWEELRPRLYTTLVINGFAILLSFLIALPLGVSMARRYNRSYDRWTGRTLLFLYAIPVFWLGSLLILLLATPGQGLHWFKSMYMEVWSSKQMGFGYYLLFNASKFVLPVLTLTLHIIAVLALQMRSSMLGVLQEDYIRTARAKGLPESKVYWRHAFRNALFPIITIFAGIFPAIFAGSLVVEYLFQVPGMGVKTQEAFISRDYPVLFAILMIASVLTVLGTLIADLLYAWADPRVRYTRK